MSRQFVLLFLYAGSLLSASSFQDYQAARAVIGQPSFSAREKGVTARALSFSQNNLYVADASGRLLTFDTSAIGSAQTESCPVCLTAPVSTARQSVFEGVAAVAVYGRNIAIADPKSHRVMLWSATSLLKQPDIVLSSFVNPTAVALDSQRLFVADAAAHHVYIWNEWPPSNNQPPDVTLGIPDSNELPGADTIQTPTALASDGKNLFVADGAARRVLIFSPADFAAPQVVNAATLAPGPVAPGTLVALNHVPSKSTVFLNGDVLPIAALNGDEVQVQIPFDLNNAAAGALWTESKTEDGSVTTSSPAALRFTSTSPGIFAFGTKEPRTGLLLHADAALPLGPDNPAKPAEVLVVWATGLGAIASDPDSNGSYGTLIPVRATINGNPVEVLSADVPAESTGVYEVRLRLPAHLSAASTLILFQNDSKSNTVTFPAEANQP